MLSKIYNFFNDMDPAGEARGNTMILNSLIALIISFMHKGILAKYCYIINENINIISIIANLFMLYTIIYSAIYLLEWWIHAERIKHMVGLSMEALQVLNENMKECYRLPLKRKLNLISCIFILFVSFLILLGLSITKLQVSRELLIITSLIIVINIWMPIKNFAWRTINN
ncbi:hypothetical protein EFO90_16545 [Lactiplantibacillus plantarum]|uniref:hypothetical protein n=1 Tax=Lactiplantibacillus plantarum TaxID=1590 RepID=UPI002182036B|nr:hypothetical protein [Lactiplantibacillus plantarum]MCS8622963.1 hypothetical protein [Lactiplantibacillus plantarum]MCT3215939.1 hypothetical protein [Lactiplantibacillus plantarum]MCT3271911.1 hypothetical protein [Lactiplantibacillus plantarum]